MRPSCAGILAEMLGLKPSTGTSRTVSFSSASRAMPAEKPEKNSKSWVGIAAAVAVVAGGTTFYLKENPAGTAEKVTAKETTATAPGKAAVDARVIIETKPAPKQAPEVAQAKPVETPKPVEATTMPKPAEPLPMSNAPAVAQAAVTAAPAVVIPPTPTPATVPSTVVAAAAPSVTAMPPPAVPPSVAAMPPPAATPPSFGSAAALLPTPTAAPASMFTAPVSNAAPPPVAPSVPLPPGYTPPPEVASQMLNQPIVADPPSGFWTVEQMFPTVPFTNYSATGKRYLLFRTQTLLKEKNIYASTVDGKEGPGTHTAIRKFQETSGLRPTGMLDVPTLVALQLSKEPDNLAWSPPASASSGSRSGRSPGGGRYTPQTEEQPGKFKRALNSIFGDD